MSHALWWKLFNFKPSCNLLINRILIFTPMAGHTSSCVSTHFHTKSNRNQWSWLLTGWRPPVVSWWWSQPLIICRHLGNYKLPSNIWLSDTPQYLTTSFQDIPGKAGHHKQSDWSIFNFQGRTWVFPEFYMSFLKILPESFQNFWRVFLEYFKSFKIVKQDFPEYLNNLSRIFIDSII